MISLLAAPGMHVLAAQAMLSRTSLQDLIELDDEGRLAIFSGIIGVERIERLSRLIAANAAAAE